MAGDYWDYDGDAVLIEIGYGRRTDTVKTGGPAQKIELAYRWRCNRLAAGVPAGQCDDANLPDANHPEWYPDIPFDIACWAFNGSSWCGNGPPGQMVFYSLRRLDGTFTYVRQANGSFQQVDTTFISGDYQMVGTDYSTASLTLNSVWRVGSDNATELPRTEFGYTMLANRWAGGDVAESGRPRLTEVLTDLGGRIKPSYTQPDPCGAYQNQSVPKWQNASDCFYVARADGTHDHYKKYLVSQVQVLDRDGSPTQTTTYGYSVNPNQNAAAPEGLGAGWHSDNQIVTPLDKQGWNQFRGYQTVTVQQLRASGAPAKEITTFFRGLHGDHTDLNNTSATRTVNVITAACPVGTPASATGTCTVTTADTDALRGKVYEHRLLDGAGMEQSADQHTYTVQTIGLSGAAVENRPWGVNTHPIVRVGETVERSLFYDASLPRNRQQTITRSFDTTYARVVWEQDSGDAATGIGATCSWTTWNTNTTDWVLDAERRTVRANGNCPASEPGGSSVIERREFLYDNLAAGSVGAGNVTQDLAWTGPNGNVTAPNQFAATKYTYDVFGHVTGVQSPNNHGGASWKTTSYTTTSGPVTSVTSTNELNHVSTTTLDPRWGVPLTVTDANNRVTTLGYDTFGRLTSVLRPGDTAGKPSTTYAYAVNQWAPSVVATTRFPSPTATGITSYAYVDSLGRVFQSERPSPTAGQRILTGTQFDDQGNAAVEVGEFVPSPAGSAGTAVANFYDGAFTAALP